MKHLSLRDSLDAEPEPGGDRRQGSWWRDNWMALAMFVCWALTQLWIGTDWLHARASNETASKAEIEQLRHELQQLPATYVRQDVFAQVLIAINQRLASIDNKLDRR